MAAKADEDLVVGASKLRRITALLNRARRASFAKPAEHKRVFRLMAKAKLLLRSHVGLRPVRTHKGQVIARHLTSDGHWTGWRSVAGMARSCASRSPSISAIGKLSHGKSKHRHISGGMMRDLMLACVKECFNAPRAPHSL